MVIDLTKLKLKRREDEILRRLGVQRGTDGMIHQIDILEAIALRLEALERKSR